MLHEKKNALIKKLKSFLPFRRIFHKFLMRVRFIRMDRYRVSQDATVSTYFSSAAAMSPNQLCIRLFGLKYFASAFLHTSLTAI